MSNTRKTWLAAALVGAMAIAGCGSDDTDEALRPVVPTPPSTQTPATAPPAAVSSTVANFIGYLLTLVGQPSDGEPLDISAVTPQTSDTTEPTTLP